MRDAWRDQPRWPRNAPPDAGGDGQGGRWADEDDIAGAGLGWAYRLLGRISRGEEVGAGNDDRVVLPVGQGGPPASRGSAASVAAAFARGERLQVWAGDPHDKDHPMAWYRLAEAGGLVPAARGTRGPTRRGPATARRARGAAAAAREPDTAPVPRGTAAPSPRRAAPSAGPRIQMVLEDGDGVRRTVKLHPDAQVWHRPDETPRDDEIDESGGGTGSLDDFARLVGRDGPQLLWLRHVDLADRDSRLIPGSRGDGDSQVYRVTMAQVFPDQHSITGGEVSISGPTFGPINLPLSWAARWERQTQAGMDARQVAGRPRQGRMTGAELHDAVQAHPGHRWPVVGIASGGGRQRRDVIGSQRDGDRITVEGADGHRFTLYADEDVMVGNAQPTYLSTTLNQNTAASTTRLPVVEPGPEPVSHAQPSDEQGVASDLLQLFRDYGPLLVYTRPLYSHTYPGDSSNGSLARIVNVEHRSSSYHDAYTVVTTEDGRDHTWDDATRVYWIDPRLPAPTREEHDEYNEEIADAARLIADAAGDSARVQAILQDYGARPSGTWSNDRGPAQIRTWLDGYRAVMEHIDEPGRRERADEIIRDIAVFAGLTATFGIPESRRAYEPPRVSAMAWLSPDPDELPGGASDIATMLEELAAARFPYSTQIPTTPELLRRIEAIWNYDDIDGTGMRSVVEGVFLEPTGGISILGSVLDDNGQLVATWKRRIDADRHVHHSLFEMHRDAQGGGFTTRWFQQVLAQYRREGFRKVTVQANIDVGGYAWSHWFDFDYGGQAERFLHEMERSVDHGDYPFISEETKEELAGLLRRSQGGEHITARQVAMVGYSRRDTDRAVSQQPQRADGTLIPMWLGKVFLLGRSWSGRMDL